MRKTPQAQTAKQTFSKNVSLVRRIKKLSQERVGELANLHRTYVGQVERGEVAPTLDAAERIAQALGMELWELLQPNLSIDALIERER